METTITICGWVLASAITLILAFFIAAAAWGASSLGYQLATRYIRERRGWKKAIRENNLRIVRHAAIVMSDRLGYGEEATLREVIKDTTAKIEHPTK